MVMTEDKLISEEEILRDIRKAEEEYRKGEVIEAESLEALLNMKDLED